MAYVEQNQETSVTANDDFTLTVRTRVAVIWDETQEQIGWRTTVQTFKAGDDVSAQPKIVQSYMAANVEASKAAATMSASK